MSMTCSSSSNLTPSIQSHSRLRMHWMKAMLHGLPWTPRWYSTCQEISEFTELKISWSSYSQPFYIQFGLLHPFFDDILLSGSEEQNPLLLSLQFHIDIALLVSPELGNVYCSYLRIFLYEYRMCSSSLSSFHNYLPCYISLYFGTNIILSHTLNLQPQVSKTIFTEYKQ